MEDSTQIHELQMMVAKLSQRLSEVENTHRVLQADDGPTYINSGDTSWILTSCALVLFMTIPGLALLYGGMARSKNVLAIVMHCVTITALITVLWLCFGYSLSFAPVDKTGAAYRLYGDASRFWFDGMTVNTVHQSAPTIPESVFCIFQLTFAIFTPALITGAFAERMKFEAMILFIGLWHLLVYCPIAHSTWHPAGFLNKYGVLDFAGGNVVHITAGVSGLLAAIFLGARKGYGKDSFEPHNILLTVVGSSMVWVGCLSFNGGTAAAANNRAGMALLATQIATGAAALSWMVTEWIYRKKPSIQGLVSGAISGLVAITPASGYVNQSGAFVTGLLAGPVCLLGVRIKHYFGYDDALDAFGVNAIGGILGSIMTGFFANEDVSGIDGANGVFYADTYNGGTQLGIQIYGVIFTILWTTFFTAVILFVLDKTLGLRVSASTELHGLDSSIHGETVVPNKVEQNPMTSGGTTIQMQDRSLSDSANKN